MKIGVVDYNAGNLRSVETALKALNADYSVFPDPERLLACDSLIFPGVGEAGAAMGILKARGLDQAIGEFVASGRPMFGICIGCQILLDHSEESDTPCLGIVPGEVKLFSPDYGLKIPHMGWNSVDHRDHPIFAGVPDKASFYFVHSYYPKVADELLEIGSTEYGNRFSAAFAVDNLVATQFHPEKSGRWGLKLLENFLTHYR